MSRPLNIGVIGIRGAWSTEALSQQLLEKGAGGAVIELQEIAYDLAVDRFDHHHHDLGEFDGFILKKMGRTYSSNLIDQLELLELLERRGHRIFSSPSKVKQMISRLACTIRLSENDVPMPPTFITEDLDAAVEWVATQDCVVLKPLYSTKARGMVLLQNKQQTIAAIEGLHASGEKIIYLQKKLDISAADYGLVYLNGEFIGAYARVGDGSSWHTTTGEGGKYAPYMPDDSLIEIGRKAAAVFGLDFSCVDIAISKEYGPVVFEVSAFGAYRGLLESAGVNASALLTDYVINELSS